jgi:predicted nucleic acid-binding protein
LVTARIHARVWAELAVQGITVGERDMMIAATAMARGYAVAARDERSFPNIPGLALLRW